MTPSRHHSSAFLVLVLAACAVAGGCGGSASDGPPTTAEPAPHEGAPDAAAPRLPAPGERFAPSHARLADGTVLDPSGPELARLADVEACEGCHADAVAQWRASAHAHSSFDNPWYRGAVDRLRADVGHRESRFCGGCHDPLLVFSGAMDGPIEPENPFSQAGVTCLVCHGIVETRPDGNGSYTLSTAPVPLPRRGDAESLAAHRRRLSPEPLKSAALCRSCHRGFLSTEMGAAHFLPGIDDAGPWAASAYAGTQATLLDTPIEEATCQGCHMADEEARLGDATARNAGTLRSHRFPGAQTALAALQDDPAQPAALAALLRGAATIDVAAATTPRGESLPADGADVRPGDPLELHVVVRNTGTGHQFPGGTRDTQDTWIELRLSDAAGTPIAEAGTRHEGAEDPTAHRLWAAVLDGEGRPERRHLVHRFEAPAFDHTISPRDAAVVRYGVTLPDHFTPPLRVEARLRHRRHLPALHAFACEGSRSARGRAFSNRSDALGRERLDPCAPQPITGIAEAVVWLGEGAGERSPTGGAARRPWTRLFDHALGLRHDLQERLDGARPTLRAAAGLARRADDDEALAMTLALLGEIEARQGRLEDALTTVEEAEALVGSHPALDRIRGDAYAQVWRWPEAAAAYDRMSSRSPRFTAGWRHLARARGSAGHDADALEAATRGLDLLPRDEGLLRSQALALAALDRPEASDANQLFLAHRRPDHAQALRFRCDREVPGCADARQPVPRIEMRRTDM